MNRKLSELYLYHTKSVGTWYRSSPSCTKIHGTGLVQVGTGLISPHMNPYQGFGTGIVKRPVSREQNEESCTTTLGTGQKPQNTGMRNRPLALFDASLIHQNALDIVSSHSLGENAVKSCNLSPFLSPSAYAAFGNLQYILFILSNLTQGEVVYA